jgi:hypothetical protein
VPFHKIFPQRLEAYWAWDGRIVGTGQTPAGDHHLTVMEGLLIPGRVDLVFPMYDAVAYLKDHARGLRDDKHSIPLFEASSISVTLKWENIKP